MLFPLQNNFKDKKVIYKRTHIFFYTRVLHISANIGFCFNVDNHENNYDNYSNKGLNLISKIHLSKQFLNFLTFSIYDQISL